MKLNELLNEAQEEIQQEKRTFAKEEIKERLREIEAAESTLAKMREQFTAFLEKSIDDVVDY